MEREIGPKNSGIWIIGDSPPKNNADKLKYPFDLKHPTVYNTVLPIIDQIQEQAFKVRMRLDWNKLYIRNTVENEDDYGDKDKLEKEIVKLDKLISQYKPIIIMTFGARALEVVRRAINEEVKSMQYWDTRKIGKEFKERYTSFNPNKTNVIPLFHACICRGKYLTVHKNFCEAIKESYDEVSENYFHSAGKILGTIILENKHIFNVWVD